MRGQNPDTKADVVRTLLAYGADTAMCSLVSTPVCMTAVAPHAHLQSLPNAMQDPFPDERGTPLHHSARISKDVVEALIEAGAGVAATDEVS